MVAAHPVLEPDDVKESMIEVELRPAQPGDSPTRRPCQNVATDTVESLTFLCYASAAFFNSGAAIGEATRCRASEIAKAWASNRAAPGATIRRALSRAQFLDDHRSR
jgi:hypothetical protein